MTRDIYDELLNEFQRDIPLQNAIKEKDAEAISLILQHRYNMKWHYLSFNETYIMVKPYIENRPERLLIIFDKDLNIKRIVKEKINLLY